VEEYMPSGLSENEAIRLNMEQSKLIELSQWKDLSVQLHASATGDRIAPTPSSPPPVLALDPPVG
jgi:hypothetical protein